MRCLVVVLAVCHLAAGVWADADSYNFQYDDVDTPADEAADVDYAYDSALDTADYEAADVAYATGPAANESADYEAENDDYAPDPASDMASAGSAGTAGGNVNGGAPVPAGPSETMTDGGIPLTVQEPAGFGALDIRYHLAHFGAVPYGQQFPRYASGSSNASTAFHRIQSSLLASQTTTVGSIHIQSKV